MQKNKQALPITLLVPALLVALGMYLTPYFVNLFTFVFITLMCLSVLTFIFPRRPCAYLLILTLAIIRAILPLPANHISHYINKHSGAKQAYTGRIIKESRFINNKYYSEIDLIKLNNFPVKGRLAFCSAQEYLGGDVIEGVGEFYAYQKLKNPESFDSEEYYAQKGIYGKLIALDIPQKIKHQANYASYVSLVRTQIISRINTLFPEQADFVKAIIVGVHLPQGEFKTKLQRAGLAHLVVVSGLHTGLLAYLCYLVLGVFIRHKNLLRIICIIIIIFYASLSGGHPSVLRASMMIILYLLAKISERDVSAGQILATSYIVIAMCWPHQALSISLIMSFLAVTAILLSVPLIKKYLPVRGSIWRYLTTAFFSSVAINIMLLPVSYYYFYQLNLNGVLANLLAIPLFGLILPLALLCLITPLFMAKYYLAAYQLLSNILFWLVNFFAGAPAHWQLGYTHFRFISLVCIIISLFAGLSTRRRLYMWTGGGACFAFVFALIFSVNQPPLVVTAFDCGQGDLTLIEHNGKNILIDTGPPTGKKQISKAAFNYFYQQDIKVFEQVIISHAHADHWGGLLPLLDEFVVKKLIVSDEFLTSEAYQKLAAALTAEKAEIIIIDDKRTMLFGELELQFLHPDKDYLADSTNNSSVVVKLIWQEFSMLFTGDIEAGAEDYLVNKYAAQLDSDVLKVAHHGSNTSSQSAFIKAVSPSYAFISVAKKNKWNFPHAITLKKLEFLADRLFVSGEDGYLQLRLDMPSGEVRNTSSSYWDNDWTD